MNLLLALLAFAGLMAFLSTLLSVFIEGLHKVFQLRRAGLEEMLRSLHDEVLVDADHGDASGLRKVVAAKTDAADFAKQVTRNVAIGRSGSFSWMRRVPVFSILFERRHEKLSTLQFVEQLAQSDAGRELQALDREQLGRALTRIAYQFERFGEAQRAYFQARARIMAVAAAIVFAFAMNIDAIYIFGRMYRDAGLRDEIIELATLTSAQQSQGLKPGAQSVAGQNPSISASAQTVNDGIAELQARGLPIGYAAFPFCVGKTAAFDERCLEAKKRDTKNDALTVAAYVPEAKLDPGKSWARLISSERLLIWLVSVLAAGAFIGLGAPFWFNVFRRIAALVPVASAVQSALVKDPGKPREEGAKEVVRDPGAASKEALVIAYEAAAPASARGAGGEPAAVSPTLSAGLVVRGDGSVTVSQAQPPAVAPARASVAAPPAMRQFR